MFFFSALGRKEVGSEDCRAERNVTCVTTPPLALYNHENVTEQPPGLF